MDEQRKNAILAKAYRLLETPIEPLSAELPQINRAEVTWQLPEPTRYRGFELETFSDMLKATEARLGRRLDALEHNLARLRNGVEGLADEAGTATGEVERKLRDEYSKEIETLRGEIALLRAQKATPQGRKTVSRAPWKDIGDAALHN